MSKITLDYTASSVVVTCSCQWRDVTTTRPAALAAAARHVDDVHTNHDREGAGEGRTLRQRHARLKGSK